MKIYSVSEFNKLTTEILEESIGTVIIQGEVSDFRVAKENLVYFELKDKSSRLLCFMMRWELTHPLEDGMEIRALGIPRLFQSSGGFHLRVKEVELVGEGALKRAFEILKDKLTGEGLFELSRKRPLLKFPQKIGLITSKEAAAYTDVLRILKNRWSGLEISHIHTGVQGPGSIKQIVSAIKQFNNDKEKESVDVLILTRGGGSFEDLQAFNSEDVVRAIFASRVPVIVGVGHERDITLADFVADRRASTPSNAAEIAVPDKKEIINELATNQKLLFNLISNSISNQQRQIKEFIFILTKYFDYYFNQIRFLIEKIRHSFSLFVQGLKEKKLEIESLRKFLISLSPRVVLKRGYSIVKKNDKIVTDSRSIKTGDKIKIIFHKGEIHLEARLPSGKVLLDE